MTAAAACAVLAAIAGCEPAEETGAPAASTTARARAPVTPSADMVSAVAAGKGESQVDLKFSMSGRPEPGEPFTLELQLTPNEPSNQLRLIVQASEGLDVQSGHDMPTAENAAPGARVAHSVTLVPQRDGIFTVSAVALFDSDTVSITRTFLIPVIVGQGITEAEPAATTVTPAHAAG